MANWIVGAPPPPPPDNRLAQQLTRHVQALGPGIYVVMVVKSTESQMEWRVLPVQTPLEKGPEPGPSSGA